MFSVAANRVYFYEKRTSPGVYLPSILKLGDTLNFEAIPAVDYVESILADDFCANSDSGVFKQMVELFTEYQCSIVAIEEVPADQTDKYGIVEGKEIQEGLFKVSNMIEKPAPEFAPTNLAIIGRYILTPDIFSIIRTLNPGANGEIQITDAICEQAKKRMVLAYKFKGRRFDCGSLEGYVGATNYVYDEYHR